MKDENSNRNHQIAEEDSEEEVGVRRARTSAAGKKRALVEDDESFEESKGHKSD